MAPPSDPFQNYFGVQAVLIGGARNSMAGEPNLWANFSVYDGVYINQS
jgi:hypothetical protein